MSILVHAYTPPRPWLGHPNAQQALDAALDRAESTIDELWRRPGPLDRVAWEPEIIGEAPAKAIAAVADTRHADEIIVGSRGFGPDRSPLGSVAHELIRLAAVPVTVIPQRVAADAAVAEAA